MVQCRPTTSFFDWISNSYVHSISLMRYSVLDKKDGNMVELMLRHNCALINTSVKSARSDVIPAR